MSSNANITPGYIQDYLSDFYYRRLDVTPRCTEPKCVLKPGHTSLEHVTEDGVLFKDRDGRIKAAVLAIFRTSTDPLSEIAALDFSKL